MRARFWHDRWQQNQIGFHQDAINDHLQQFWSRLKVAAESWVFVPLCGKSRDMLWLRSQGYRVLGIELSPIAVKDFFAENNLNPTITPVGQFERWEADGLVILLGDFFQLSAEDIAHCHAIYDRASLIAMPADMRLTYAQHMNRIAPAHVPTLLITLEYDQSITSGPPFAVLSEEVAQHYGAHYQIESLAKVDVSDEMSGLKNRGVTVIEEQVYLLTPFA